MRSNVNLKQASFDWIKTDRIIKPYSFKFMDFCAGIGAGRLGLEKAGGICVGYSEILKSSFNL